MQKFKKIGFFLIPGKKINREISNKKKYFKEFSNNQNFLNDFPHLTLFHGNYENFNKLDLTKITDNSLNHELKEFKYTVNKKYIFEDDVEKGFSTLIYLLKHQNLIQNIQAELLSNLKPSLPSHFSNLNKNYSNNLKLYGYPYVAKDFIPHFTVTNIKELSTDEKERFLNEDVNIVEKFSQFLIGEIVEDEIRILEELW